MTAKHASVDQLLVAEPTMTRRRFLRHSALAASSLSIVPLLTWGAAGDKFGLGIKKNPDLG
jgi:hypothetical protein